MFASVGALTGGGGETELKRFYICLRVNSRSMLYARRHSRDEGLPPALPPADESATRAERPLHINVDLDYSSGRGSLDSPNAGFAVCDSGWRVTRQGSDCEDAMVRHMGSPAWRCLSTHSFPPSAAPPPAAARRALRER